MEMPPDPYWEEQAGFNEDYSRWLQQLDTICNRFLSVSYTDVEIDLDAFDAFDCSLTPETFFRESVIPYMRNEQGCDFVEDLVGQQVLWGDRS